ncbi:MAG: MOFRL family protein, partial [Gemmatales bacterium]|nr:glycerate kinase [Gemmatales bacterium]MDW8176329.1 MOFRL family protein [Gemmatales bacterium]
EGETSQVAQELAQQARQWQQRAQRPLCVLSGGETTVTLPPHHGKGGRNQEFALAFLQELSQDGLVGLTLLAAGTDGEDGPTDAAGAFADADALQRAHELHLHPADYLRRHDAYHFFHQIDALFRPGLTETNVMDLRVLLIEPRVASIN